MTNAHIANYLKQLCFIIALLAVAYTAAAQNMQDTLQEVHVHGNAIKPANDDRINIFSPGQKIKAIDSITLQQYKLQSIGNLLAQQAPVFIKSYTFNGLATLNFRGASAAQSQVLWNGVPIQNAALGIADVSTLPVMLINKVDVVYGSSSALWGSGNVGGALLLENDLPVFNGSRTLSVSAGAGSYGQYLGGVKAGISTKKLFFSLNAFGQAAQNNYAFNDDSGKKQHTANDHLKSGSVLLETAYKIATDNVISFTGWYQRYDRQIPAALFEDYSVKNEQDGSLRLLLGWNKQSEHGKWYAKASFIQDYLRYSDSAILLNTHSVANQYYQEAGWEKILNEHSRLLIFIPIQAAWIRLKNKDSIKTQDKAAIAAAYQTAYFRNRLNVAVNAREEVVDGSSFFLPGADATFMLRPWLSVKANVQRTYRVPTLNELYYYPGGNTSLKPEQGWNEDGGYAARLKTGSFTISQETSVFNRLINDWIIWLGGAIWTPHNIATVHSRGIETENNIEWKLDKWKLHVGGNTSYIIATTVNSYIANDGSIGKQIPYSPRYSAQLNLGFAYKNLYFNYNQTYTWYRFITTDESEYILPYSTGNTQVMLSTALGNRAVQITAQVNNIWNRQYQVVAYRPMPGVNWLTGISLNL